MRRAVPAIIGTVAGLAALLGYKTGGSPQRAVAAPSSTTTAAAPAAVAAQPRAVAGSVVVTRFGDVQVQATVQGGQLLDVTTLQMPFDHQRSQVISERAAPILRAEALQAQGTNIDTVSGATYTSDAYVRSLQGALDVARR